MKFTMESHIGVSGWRQCRPGGWHSENMRAARLPRAMISMLSRFLVRGSTTIRLLSSTSLTVLVAFMLLTPVVQAAPVIRLSTTTSTENSGLLAYLLPQFAADTGVVVQVISVGSGKALELAKNGDVDVTLVHARASEDKFVAAGHGVNRRDVMYNDFVLVGPDSDPAGIAGGRDVLSALKTIIERRARFISRGDHSGTDQMEQTYWQEIGMKPSGRAYISAGLGMGQVLTMAAELDAYTLTDRATYATYRRKTGLAIMVERDPRMHNPYGVIAVNPSRHPHVNYKGAMAFIDWITSDKGQRKIAAFRRDGQQLFFPSPGVSR
jgi:tungstate transport system substrate-binding protein